MRVRWTKENLEPVVMASFSMSDVLVKLGLRKAGGNYQNIKNRIKFFNISIKHFDPPHIKKLINRNKVTKFKPEEVLVENCERSRNTLKRIVLSHKLIEYKCRECGLTDYYNAKKLVLHLEHINGIFNDNRLENLCFLCPNCHSQTSTYSGKNINKLRSSMKVVQTTVNRLV